MILAGQDIAPIPPIRDPDRRARADGDFRFFAETYFPELFSLAWSDDHLRVLAKIERTVLHGDTFAVAMPRGSGKTTLCQVAVIWALMTGRHPFVFLIAGDDEYALGSLDNIKTLMSTSQTLYDDYPEAIHPIRKLEGEARRCGGQRYYGRLTGIQWNADSIVLASIPNAKCSGATVRVSGLMGHIRGAVHIRPDGSSVRPSLAIIDDPQTDQTARSPTQCRERLGIVNGAILGMAGPGRSIAVIMPCTVIRSGDVADTVLDREANPQWQGERSRMVYSFPKNEALWTEYTRLRMESLRAGGRGEAATEYYASKREAMDEGAAIAWPARRLPDELSGLQHAMNIKIDRGDVAFFAEYQNQPIPEESVGQGMLTSDDLGRKCNGMPRAAVPLDSTHITMFVDVQEKALYWLVAAWRDDFTGAIIDYGTEPDQKDAHFALRTLRYTLAAAAPRAGLEGSIRAGLDRLAQRILDREWPREDGTMLRVSRCLIDANWHQSTNIVYDFCRTSVHASALRPSHGRGIGASMMPMTEYRRQPGEKIGMNWMVKAAANRRAIRYALYDTNWWKSFVHARLSVALGDPGCLSVFGRDAQRHQLLFDHLLAEYYVRTQGRGRAVDEWKIRTPGADNHWLDCLVGVAVAASMEGVVLTSGIAAPKVDRPRVSFAERQAAARARQRQSEREAFQRMVRR